MCIVTYIPLQEDSFIIVSSREESESRTSSSPAIHNDSSYQFLYPKDQLSQGTWILATTKGKMACLLNGAIKPHEKKSSYKHSRGLIPIKYAEHKSFMNFYFQYDIKEVEPFTLIAYEDRSLFELKWDGERHHVKTLIKAIPHIWSSVTLYNQEVISEREILFKEWVNKKSSSIGLEDVVDFHKKEKQVKEMSNPQALPTLSITAILYDKSGAKMIYEDLKTGKRTEENVKF